MANPLTMKKQSAQMLKMKIENTQAYMIKYGVIKIRANKQLQYVRLVIECSGFWMMIQSHACKPNVQLPRCWGGCFDE